jgi:hypothetical protein
MDARRWIRWHEKTTQQQATFAKDATEKLTGKLSCTAAKR